MRRWTMELPWSAKQAAAAAVDWRDAEEIEAEVRVLMARHSAIVARGFDSSKKRQGIHRKIDDLLDELDLLT